MFNQPSYWLAHLHMQSRPLHDWPRGTFLHRSILVLWYVFTSIWCVRIHTCLQHILLYICWLAFLSSTAEELRKIASAKFYWIQVLSPKCFLPVSDAFSALKLLVLAVLAKILHLWEQSPGIKAQQQTKKSPAVIISKTKTPESPQLQRPKHKSHKVK